MNKNKCLVVIVRCSTEENSSTVQHVHLPMEEEVYWFIIRWEVAKHLLLFMARPRFWTNIRTEK